MYSQPTCVMDICMYVCVYRGVLVVKGVPPPPCPSRWCPPTGHWWGIQQSTWYPWEVVERACAWVRGGGACPEGAHERGGQRKDEHSKWWVMIIFFVRMHKIRTSSLPLPNLFFIIDSYLWLYSTSDLLSQFSIDFLDSWKLISETIMQYHCLTRVHIDCLYSMCLQNCSFLIEWIGWWYEISDYVAYLFISSAECSCPNYVCYSCWGTPNSYLPVHLVRTPHSHLPVCHARTLCWGTPHSHSVLVTSTAQWRL